MNDFGISLFTPSGQEYFSTKSTTWTWIGTFIAPANQTEVRKFEALSLLQHISSGRAIDVIFQRSFYNGVPENQAAIIHTCSVSGDTVTASGGNVDSLIVVLAR